MCAMASDNSADPHPGDDLFDEGASARPRPGERPPDVRLPAPGMLLVSTPFLVDPNFRRTVVYLIAHGTDGSAGLVLNRRTETAVHTILPLWSSCAARPQAVFAGGPVQLSGAMCLGVARTGVDPHDVSGVVRVAGSVVLVDLDSDPEEAARRLDGVRIFAGHSGWGPGQLDNEIAEGAWHVLPGRAIDILSGPRVDLWFRILKRQGFPLAWQAYLPADLARN